MEQTPHERKRALCQNCLRVRFFDSYDEATMATCDICDGDMCACDNCQEAIERLERGERDFESLTRPILGWSAEDGITETGNPQRRH